MYKVREKADMDVDVGDFQMAKSPITTSHGDSLADQSFQSFKTKEIRDSESPTHDLKFKTHALTDRSGWNVSTSLEVTPDGKGRVTESLMTTGGLQSLPDGVSEFAGKNKHLTQVYHDGDDKNFVSSKAESSKTHLEETIKKGGDNFNQTESTSVTTKFSSSQAIQSHQSVANDFDDLVASALPNKVINTTTSRREESIDNKKPIHDEHVTQKHFQNVEHQNQQLHKEHQHTEQKTLQNVTNQSTSNQSKQQIVRTLQEEAEILAAKPGTIISRTVEYPDPNTKVITETKSLPDGTTVTTRKYETKSASSKSFRSSSNQEQYHTSRTVVEDRGHRNCLEYVLDDGTSNKTKTQSKPPGGVPGQKTIIDTINRETIDNRNVTRDNIGTQHNTFIKKTPKEHPTDSLPSKDTLDHEVEYISVAPTHRVPKKIPADKMPLHDMEDFIETERGCVMVDKRTPMPEKYTVPTRQDIPVTRQLERNATTQTQTSRSVQEHRELIESHEHKEHQEHKEHREVKKITQGNQGHLPEPMYTDGTSYPSDKCPSDLREPKPDFTTHGFPSVKPPYNHDYPIRPASRQPSETKETTPDFSTHGFPSVKSPKKSEFSHPGDYNHPSTPQLRPQTIRSEPQPIQPHKITQSEQTTSSRRESTDSTYQKETTTTTTTSTAQTTFEKTVPSYPAGKPSYTKVKETDLAPPKQVSRQPEKTSMSPREYVPNESSRIHPAGVPSYQRPLNREPRTRDHPISPTSYAPVDNLETRAAGKPSYTQTKTTEVVRTEVYEYPDKIDKPRAAPKPGDYAEPNKDESFSRDYPTRPGDHQPYNKKPFATNDVIKTTVHRHDLREPADVASTPGSTRPVTPTERPQDLDNYFSPDRRSPGDYGVPGYQVIPQKAAGKPSYNKPKLMDDTHDYETSKLTTREIAVLKQERTDVTTKKISVEVSATHDAFARSLRCISPVDKDRGSVRSIKTSTSSIRSSVSPDKKTRRSPSTETPQRITRTSTPRYQQPTKATSRSPDSNINRYKSNETVDLTTNRLQEDEVKRRGTKTTTTKTVETRKALTHKPTNRKPEDIVPRAVQKSPEHILGPSGQPTYDEDTSPVVVMRKDRPSMPKGEPNERKSRPNTFTFDSDTEPIIPDDGNYTVEPTDKHKPVESLPASPSKILKQSKEPKPLYPGVPRGMTYDIDDAPHVRSPERRTKSPLEPSRITKPRGNLTEKSAKPTRPALRRDQTPDVEQDLPSPSPYRSSSPASKSPTRTVSRPINIDSPRPTGKSPKHTHPGVSKDTRNNVDERPHRRSPSPFESSPTKTVIKTTTTKLVTSTDTKKATEKSPRPTRSGLPKDATPDVVSKPYRKSPRRSLSPSESSPTRTHTTTTTTWPVTATDTKKPTDRSPKPIRPGLPKGTTYEVEERPDRRYPGRSPTPSDSSPTRTFTAKNTTRLVTSTDTGKPTDRSPKPTRPGRPKETTYEVEERPDRRSAGRSPTPSDSSPTRTQTTTTTTRLVTSIDTKKPIDRSPKPTRPGGPKETTYDVEQSSYHRSPGRNPSPSDSSPTRTQTTSTTSRLVTSTDTKKPTDITPTPTRPGRPKETPYEVKERPYRRSPGRSPSPSDSSPTRTQTTTSKTKLITSAETEKPTDRSPKPTRPGRPKETTYEVEERPYRRSPGRSPSPGDSSPTRTQTTTTTTRLITSTEAEKPTDRSPKPTRPGRPKGTPYDVEERSYRRSPGRSPSPSDSSPTRTQTTTTTTRLITSTEAEKPTDRSPKPTRPGRPKETPYDVEERPYSRSPGRSPSPSDSSPTRTQTATTTTRLITSTEAEKPTDRSPKPTRPGRPKETTYDVEERPYHRSPGRSPSPSDSSPTRTQTTISKTKLITSADTEKPTDRSPKPTRPGRPKETTYEVEERPYRRSPGRSPSPSDSSPTRTQTTTTTTRLITSTETEKPTDRSPKPTRPGGPKETTYDVEERPYHRSPGRSPSPSDSSPTRTQTTISKTKLITSADTEKPTDRSPKPTRPGRPKETTYEVEERPYRRSPGRSPSPCDSSPTRTQTTTTTTRLITSADTEKPTDRSPKPTRPGRPKETPYEVAERPYHRSPGRSPSPSDSSPTRTQTTTTTTRLITSTDAEKPTDRSPKPTRPGRPKEATYDVEERPYHRSPGRSPSPSDSSPTRTQTTISKTKLITSADTEKPTDRSPKPTRPGHPKETPYELEERPYHRSPGRSPSPSDSSPTRTQTTITTTRLVTSTETKKPTDRSPKPSRPGRPKETTDDVEERPYHRSPGRSPSPSDYSPKRTQTTTTTTRLISSTDAEQPTDRSPKPTRPGRPKETTYDVEERPYHRSPGRSPSPSDSSPTRTQTTISKTKLITSADTEKPTDRSPKPTRPGHSKETPYELEERAYHRSPGRSPSPSDSSPTRTQTTTTTTRLVTSTETKKPTDRSPKPSRPGRPKETTDDVEERPYHRSPGRSPSPSDYSPKRTQTTTTTTRLISSTDAEQPTDRSPKPTRPGRPKETTYDVEERPYHRSPGRSPSPSDSSPTRTQTTISKTKLITSADTEKPTDRSPKPTRPGHSKETPYELEERAYHRSPGRSPSPSDSSPTRTQTTTTTTRLVTSTETKKPTDRSPKPSRPGRPKETTDDVEERPYHRSPGRSPSPSDYSPKRTQTTTTTTRLISSTDAEKPTDQSPKSTRPGRPKETPYEVEERPYRRSPCRSPSPSDSLPTGRTTTVVSITSKDLKRPTKKSSKDSTNDVEERHYKRRSGSPVDVDYDFDEPSSARSPYRDENNPNERPKSSKKPVKEPKQNKDSSPNRRPSSDKALKTPIDKSVPLTPVRQSKYPKDVSREDFRQNDVHPEDAAIDLLVDKRTKDIKSTKQTTRTTTEDFISNEQRTFDVNKIRTVQTEDTTPYESENNEPETVVHDTEKPNRSYLRSPERKPSYGDSPDRRTKKHPSTDFNKVPQKSPKSYDTSPTRELPESVSAPNIPRKKDGPVTVEKPTSRTHGRQYMPDDRDVSNEPSQKLSKRYYSKSPEREPNDKSPESFRRSTVPMIEPERCIPSYKTRPDSPSELNSAREKYPQRKLREPIEPSTPKGVRPSHETSSTEKKPRKPSASKPTNQQMEPEDITIEVVLQKEGKDIHLTTTVEDTKQTSKTNEYVETIERRRSTGPTKQYDDHEPDEFKEPLEPFFLNPKQTEEDRPVDTEKVKPKVPYNRSETYEERCRKILGMDNPDENIKTKQKSRYDDTSDFITTEVTHVTENRGVMPKKTTEDVRSKPARIISSTSRSPAPSREMSPTKRSTEKTKEDMPKFDKKPATQEKPYEDTKSKKKTKGTSPIISEEPQDYDNEHPDNQIRRPSYSSTAEIIIGDMRERSTSPEKRSPSGFENLRKTQQQNETSVTRRTSKTKREHTHSEDELIVETVRSTKKSGPRSPERLSKPKTNKPSSPDRQEYLKTDKTVTSSSRRAVVEDSTTKSSKSIVTKATVIRPSKDKLPISQSPNERVGREYKPTSSDRKKPKLTDDSEQETDIVTDEETGTTITKTRSTVKTTKKLPVFERKESAPVTPVTKKDKIMTRSTSDNVLRTTTPRKPKSEIHPLSSKPTEKSSLKTHPEKKVPTEKSSPRRPTKCLTTKTINLSSTTKLLTPDDMENMVIDIQQAKSSREPTPNKIIPTPVLDNLDTGAQRYPDTVQEPEDVPRRKPKVKNIPIYEEETNEFVGCHIEEVTDDTDTIEDTHERQIKTTTRDETFVDECLLSVHDKVNKFTITAEEVKKPKPSAPFRPEPRLEDVTDTEDECLLSVNDKVNKFLTTAESISKRPIQHDSKWKPERPDLDNIDENLRTDDCVLSVSEKVNKFTSTAQKLSETAPQKSPELVAKITKQIYPRNKLEEEPYLEPTYRPASPQRSPGLVASIEKQRTNPEYYEVIPEELERKRTRPTVTERYNPDKPKDIIRHTISPSVTARSSVQKVKSVFEKEPVSVQHEKPRQRDILSRPSVWDSKKPKDVKLEDIGIHRSPEREIIEVTETTVTKHEHSPLPGSSTRKPRVPTKTQKITADVVSSKKDIFEKRISNSTRETIEIQPTTKTTISRTSTKNVPVTQKPSSIKKIAEKFSAPAKPTGSPIKSSPKIVKEHVDETFVIRRPKEPLTYEPGTHHSPRKTYTVPRDDLRESSPGQVPTGGRHTERPNKPKAGPVEYIEEEYYSKRRTSRTDEETVTEQHTDSTRRVRNGDLSPARHYMEHTVSSIEHRRDSESLAPGVEEFDYSPRQSLPRSSSPSPSRHFMDHTVSSMEHRRDSDLAIPIVDDHHCHVDGHQPRNLPSDKKFGVELKHSPLKDSRPRRKSSSSEIPHIEEIYDLDLLEKMLETVVGYEQRRRIRAQIRVVKKTVESPSHLKRITQPTKKVSEPSLTRKPATSTSRPKNETSPEKMVQTVEATHLYTGKPKEIIYIPTKTTTTMTSAKTEFRMVGKGPEKTITTKKTVVSSSKEPKDEPPIWTSKNILKKPSDNDKARKTTTVLKKTTGIGSTAGTKQKIVKSKVQVTSDEDCITSSYGIGPTDDNGEPLFGIKALKKKTTTTSTSPKVSGRIITKKFYSENGAEPVSEETVVTYGTDQDDTDNLELTMLDDDSTERKVIKRGGVTTTIVKKGNVTSRKDSKVIPEITEKTTKQSKVVRRGSVKEISEKFVRKESSSSVSERTTSSSFPKAGLILRTQTRTVEDTDIPETRNIYSDSGDCDDVTDDNVEMQSSSTSTRKESKSFSKQIVSETESETESRSFLDSQGTKITGVKDVIQRMKNADYVVEDGDSPEDQEARSLLNKFLGASVIMTGVETMVPKEVTTTITKSPSTKGQVTTTRVTKTIRSGSSSSPVVSKTCDIEEIDDEKILKQLLEESTNYEDRRKIRARLRKIMADREACTDTVEEEQVTTEETINGKTIKTTTTTRKTNGGKEEVETTVEEEEEGEDEEEDEEEEEEEEDDEEEEEVEVVEEVEEDIKESAEKEKKESQQRNGKDEEEEEDDNDSDYEEVEVVEVVEVDESEEEEDSKDSQEVKVETVKKLEESGNEVKNQNTTVKVEEDGTKVITTTTTVVKETSDPKKTESRELVLSSKEGVNLLMEKPHISQSSSASQEGESLLLPLLQGLLHKNMPTNRNQSSSNSNPNKIKVNNNLGTKDSNNNKLNHSGSDSSGNSIDSRSRVTGGSNTLLGSDLNPSGILHHVEDSGTESGEDLKLIAAGLRNSMHRNVDGDEDSGDIIEDVTVALKRLESSLLNGKDIKLDPHKRNALLVLVGRLQTGLKAPENISVTTDDNKPNEVNDDESETKRPSRSSQRFAKRRSRANRHTVGVSREELADARRYIEEMVLLENISNSTTPESNPTTTPPEFAYNITKDASLGNLKETNNIPKASEFVLLRPNQFLPSHLKGTGTVASPNKSVNDKPVQMREKKPNAPQFRQSLSLDTKSGISADKKDRPLSESYADLQFQQKLSTNHQQPVYPTSSRDLDKETVNQRVQEKNLYNKTHHFNQPPWVQSNPNNIKVPKMSAEAPSPTTETKKSNKFITKKMMMKRANTIDIPKPLKYMNDMDSDSEADDNGLQSTKSIGLRGTVQVNIKNRPKQVVPSFEPKTENDHKFLAFIQKQQTTTNTPTWNNPKKEESSGPANWTNKFGNIKNAFEAGANGMRDKPPMPMSSARNFWKKTEQSNVPPSTAPKFYEKPRVPTSPVNKTHDKIVKPPWSEQSCNSEVVTGTLRIKEPPSPRLQSESPKIMIPKPIPVNKFSHAPMSAFKPVAQPKAEPVKFKPIISEPNPAPIVNGSYIEPMYKSPTRPHHSPQRPLYPQNNVNQSPTMSIPWATQPNMGNRVLNKASKIQSKQSYSEVEQMYHNRDDPPSDYGRIQPSGSQVQHSPQYNYAYSNKQLNSPGLVRPYQNVNQTPLEHLRPGQHIYGHSAEGTSSGYSGSQYNRPSVSVSSENCNQTSSLSTYSTDKYSQNDSLINPNAQPLILTHDTPVISPQLQRKQEPLKIFDYPSPSPTTCTTQYEMSDDGLDLSEVMEYKAESKVMQGPVSQQAVTVAKRTSHIGDEKNTVAAKNLLTTMRDIGNKTSGTLSNMPQKTSPAPIFPGFHGSFTDVVFPADPLEENNMSSGDFSRTGPVVNEFNTTTFSAPLQSYVPPARNTTIAPPPQITYTSTSQISNAPGPQVQTHSLRPQKVFGSSPQMIGSSVSYAQSYNNQDRSSLPTTPTNESKNTYYSRSFSHQTPSVSVNNAPAAQPNYRPNEQITENHQRYQQSQLVQRKFDQENMEIQGNQRNLMSLQQTSQAVTKPSVRENDLTKPKLPQSQSYGGVPQQKSNNSYGYQHNSVVATFTNKSSQEPPHFDTRSNQTIQKNDNSQYNASQKSSIISGQREQTKQSEKVESFSMPHYQKNLLSSSQAEATKDDAGRPESPVKASAPKTDKIPVFKKFGPAQPHLYTPNCYKYPLSSQPESSERRNRFQNRVGSAQAPRKYSEPEIKFSEYKTKQTSQTTLATSHTTDQSKFQAPQIIETPSTPLTASKNELPPNIIYNNVGQRPMIRQTFETTHDGESVVSYKFPIPTNRSTALSKSDSWHQICQQSQQVAMPPSPRSFGAADTPGLPLRRAKSGHSLAVPKMFEAGIDKSQVVEKQRTVAAYFSGQKSPSRNSPQNVSDLAMASTSSTVYETKQMTSSPTTGTSKKSSINRIKTSSKASISNQNPSSGLARSQTMPHIPNIRLLDESNVEDAFEQILNCS